MLDRKTGNGGGGAPRRPPEPAGGKTRDMNERFSRPPRPRVRPQMNTDTRRHEPKSIPARRSKYREDFLDNEDLQEAMEPEDDGGVLADYPDEPDVQAPDEPDTLPPDEAPVTPRRQPGRRG